MLKISTLNDKFIINHDNKTTAVPSSNLVSFTLFQYTTQKKYEAEVNFISDEKIDGFTISPNQYSHNGKLAWMHNFYSFSTKHPFEIKHSIEQNPFVNNNGNSFADSIAVSEDESSRPTFIEIQVHKEHSTLIHYINLDYLTSFDIGVMLDTNIDLDILFKVHVSQKNETLDVQKQTLALRTFIDLYVGDQILNVETECFVNALQNIKLQLSNKQSKVEHWINEVLDFIKQTLENYSFKL